MARETLPPRRQSLTLDFEHDGFAYRATFGVHPGGRIGELFLDAGKSGTHLETATRDAAIAVSLALQHGCPVDTLRGAFLRGPKGEPAGIMARVFDMLEALA